ncbi:hypothetical protein PCO31111_04525 [Pandoraea communis]|uniref:Uncharacterized protein n=1 Tax=Pandoraea communis TaxID=2508297 RepID=A0A5E4YFV4_9BURK|nr:hypothetical protein [Pandoraea communis]VVE47621.1 hypothetical protein PCO31111_04525 [Pandoraea communis]
MPDLKTVTFDAIREAVGRITEVQRRSGGPAWMEAKGLLANDLTFIAQGLIDALAAAPTSAAQSAGQEVVAYRLLRRDHNGEWKNDGRAWCDGSPPAVLVDDVASRDGWRIEYAYATPVNSPLPDWFGTSYVPPEAAPVNGGERDEDGIDLREAAEMAVEAFGLLGGLIGNIRAKGNYSQETTIRFLEEAQMCIYRLHGLMSERPSDCSGAPECCPQNEGYGCHCGTRNSDVQCAADAPQVGGDQRDELMRLMTEYEGALQDGEGDEEVIAPARAALTNFLRPVLAALTFPAKVCEYCDDTGDVHDRTGEWRGTCTCPAGVAISSPAKVGGDEREAFDRCYIRMDETARTRMAGDDWYELDPDERSTYRAFFHAGATWQARAALSADGGEWRKMVEAIVDIYDDETTNAPEERGYVEGSFTAVMNEARAAIAAKAKGE